MWVKCPICGKVQKSYGEKFFRCCNTQFQNEPYKIDIKIGKYERKKIEKSQEENINFEEIRQKVREELEKEGFSYENY